MIEFFSSSLLFPFFPFGVSGRMWKKNGSVPEDYCRIFYARSITFRKAKTIWNNFKTLASVKDMTSVSAGQIEDFENRTYIIRFQCL